MKLLPVLLLACVLSLGVACASEPSPTPTRVPPTVVPTLTFDEEVAQRVKEKKIEAAAKALLPTCTRTSMTRQSGRLWIEWMRC